jgi:hypothetical protein
MLVAPSKVYYKFGMKSFLYEVLVGRNLMDKGTLAKYKNPLTGKVKK